MTTTENKLRALAFLKISKTLVKLETYLDLIKYIRQYVHFYAAIFRLLQNLKTQLLKAKSANSVDVKKKIYISKMKLLLTLKEKESFGLLQKTINKVFILIHFNFNRMLWIDLNEFKKHDFDIMIFYLRKETSQNITSLRTQIELIMFLLK